MLLSFFAVQGSTHPQTLVILMVKIKEICELGGYGPFLHAKWLPVPMVAAFSFDLKYFEDTCTSQSCEFVGAAMLTVNLVAVVCLLSKCLDIPYLCIFILKAKFIIKIHGVIMAGVTR